VEELIGEMERAGTLGEAEERGRSLIAEAREALALPRAGFPGSPGALDLLAGLVDCIS
jgi:hypothetical protein